MIRLVVQRDVQNVCSNDVAEVLDLRLGTCAALVGGGGKTTTMLEMARSLRVAGRTALITTTTRIWPPEGVPLVCGEDAASVSLAAKHHFRQTETVALGDHVGSDGKLYGISPALACDLLRRDIAHVLLCEADGSAGRSLKAYGPGEPVIPPCASLVLAITGVDAVGKSATSDVIHRSELFCRRAGLPPGARLEPSSIALGLFELARPTPATARVVYVLNKVDDPAARISADAVSAELRKRQPDAEVLLLSRGRVVAHFRSEDVGVRLSPR